MSRSGEARKPRAEVRVKALADENATLRAEVKHLRAELDAATTLHREVKARLEAEKARESAGWAAARRTIAAFSSDTENHLREENTRLISEADAARRDADARAADASALVTVLRAIEPDIRGTRAGVLVAATLAHPKCPPPASDKHTNCKPPAVEGNGQWSTGSPR